MSLTLARLGIVAGSFPIAAGGDFESIATVTVGSGGAANIEFTSIPSTYAHLQIRMIARGDRATSFDDFSLRLNGDTGLNYAAHFLYGTGAAVGAYGESSRSTIWVGMTAQANAASGIFGASFVDILDYSSATKNTTVRALSGVDINGSGQIYLRSGLWMNTSAVSSLTLFRGGTEKWVQHTTAALYGVKAP